MQKKLQELKAIDTKTRFEYFDYAQNKYSSYLVVKLARRTKQTRLS